MTQAAIALGSNIGDRLGTMRQAVMLLEERSLRISASSDVFETPPWGMENQPRFLNACVLAETDILPRALLELLLNIESDLGRIRRYKWGPREIDLDLLFYDDQVFNESGLVLPHPQMHRRVFVLVPLVQIAPDWRHPVLGKSIRELAGSMDASSIIRITRL
ncbi:MAG: 2-amino-4-hydroxy-6-hydroxymethyldihydropteridine diphosphokinase [Synergistales bacterium]|nr:2-amino-4-hydroxy-6-hydroxymethyldihydropteridine diphosphokinase [Synergistales bacterium]MDN5335392.1 2-amino-4-hydroxy-6-hydroxymethyldihydropteridine diphosphokinase [Synergistales bacterium]